ncbi:MAG: hypothetical protein GQ574_08230 [Crocinitomix sp.]|nr:hypothetical protein [Crocinitomix sp.]
MTDKNPIEDLREIRKMMESSSKFLSLSGLSGIFAGLTALVGAYFAYQQIMTFEKKIPFYIAQGRFEEGVNEFYFQLLLLAILILVTAISFGILFTWLKAKRQNKKLWTPLSLRLIISLMVPLGFGGLFIAGLFYNGFYILIAPTTLIIYGLALLNGSKYVHVDIKYLALCQMALGVASVFFLDHAFLAWVIGFGVLHILYGTIMYFKYDRKQKFWVESTN